MTTSDFEGYVIRAVNYRDSDQMITFLTPDGLISFLAHGVNKPTSKNGPSCRLLSHSKITLSQGKVGGWSLSESICLDPAPEKEDLATMASLTFLTELSAQTIQEDEAKEAYPWLSSAVEAIRKGFDPLTACLIYFAHLLVISGFGLNVDGCVYCQEKRNIVGISYQDGGFVCKNCLNDSGTEASPRKLKIIRYCFRCGLEDFSRVSFQKDECKDLLTEWGLYLNDLTGVTLKSLSIIQKL
jgi:DNA repair protein RecO (recombination protein O)